MKLLGQVLIKYSKQIGIIDCEIPELVFTIKEFNAKDKETKERLGLDIAPLKKRCLGACSISRRMVLVRTDWTPKKVWKVTRRTKKCKEWEEVRYGLRGLGIR